MKKIISLALASLLIVSLLTGCAGTTVVINECNCETNAVAEETVTEEVAEETTEEVAEETTEVAEGAVKTGLAVVTSVKDSVSATAEENGAVKYDITLAAVTVDADGVIRACAIDSVPATINMDAKGEIVSDLTAAIITKGEQGADYGMVAYGGAIAEWDEQVAALCEFAIGKTVDELKNGAIDESGKAPEGSDLASSATIYLGGYVGAIEAAVNNAQDLGAQNGDTLSLVTLNSMDSTVAATEEKEGTAQLDVNIGVITHKDGVVTSCVIDAVQAKVAFDAEGTITTDLAAPIQTKNELGENYGMVAWGGAIAEWNEQAASYASYITGKTADEIAGIAVTEATKPEEGTDLASSVTIAIGGFQGLVAKVFGE